ncbi:UNVERIFIED_CONTAM: hypothetical protein RMT77_006414 [Armadillidium vulgare]
MKLSIAIILCVVVSSLNLTFALDDIRDKSYKEELLIQQNSEKEESLLRQNIEKEESLLRQNSEIEESLIRQNSELKERLSRQLKWLEPSKVLFKKSDLNKEDVGRLFNFGLGGSRSISQLDLLINTANQALIDLSHICEEISEKFERFVHLDEANKLNNQVGSQRLFDMLQDFRLQVTTTAQRAVASVIAFTQNRGLLGGLLGGLGR